MTQARLEQIESKIAFLEHTTAQLSEEILHQSRLIDELRAAVTALSARLEASKSDGAPWSSQDERPPHY
jgi:uncharacterized coiled-coil protein SlyX